MGAFNEKCAQRGYSVTAVYLEFYKRYGYPSHITTFRRAVKDKPNKSRREEMITETAEKMLAKLPDLKTGSFAKRARAKGFSVREVWERYNATREPHYTLGSFKVALSHPMCASERRILAESEKCLDELVNMRNNP